VLANIPGSGLHPSHRTSPLSRVSSQGSGPEIREPARAQTDFSIHPGAAEQDIWNEDYGTLILSAYFREKMIVESAMPFPH